ncbi:TetR/AcrR family transcriptional regulator [Nocardia mangyaensis]|uniref:TetR/AcrR family transcriptional regulator n=1 Tax=Nocardia mangyaensis TaxID=2213200 RepID=UPI002674ED88|nr:TetR/AcrR family transcriptional regulator [Nocardia mangyaensis]MDO3646320.1 TetR/AcrR family transcriptional regulator [Nocardia mangyaensis]
MVSVLPGDTRAESARAERRRIVLTAAREIFVRHGYHGASMDDIGIRAGMSKPVLYTHFASKLDLYLAVLQIYLDRMVEGTREALNSPPGEHKVRRAVRSYFDFVDQDAGGHTLVFESAVPSEPVVRWRVRNAMAECAVLVSAELRAAGMPDARAYTCAFGLVGASHAAARHWLDAGRPIPKDDAIDTTVALYWTGLSGIRQAAAQFAAAGNGEPSSRSSLGS